MNQKTAIIYARVSDKKQVENDISIPGQIEKGYEKASEFKADVLQVFKDEGISGRSDNRPGFESAIEYCELNDVDHFICWSSSRFARNRFNAAVYKRRLDKCGTKLNYLTFSVDRDTDSGRLLDSFLEIIDEHKSIQTSRDTSRSLIKNARAGYWNGGRPAFGFKVVPAIDNPKRKKLDINDDEAHIVKKIFELRVEGYGVRTISQWLNDQGLLNRSRMWTKTTVSNLLHNMVVLGKTAFGKESRVTGRKNPIEQWIIVDSHEPIISMEIWEVVQESMGNDNLKTRTSSPKSTYKLTGLLRCGECGASMHTESAKGRSRRYWYYNCSAAKLEKAHASRRIPADDLDDYITSVLITSIFGKDSLEGVVSELYEAVNQWQHEHSKRRKRVLNSINKLQTKLNNLYETLELFGKNAPNLGDLTRRLRQHNDQIKIHEIELSNLDKEKPPKINVTERDISDMSDFLIDIIKKSNNPKHIRTFFSTFIKDVTIYEDTLKIRYDPQKLVNRPELAVPSKRIWLPDLDSNQGQTD